jgi:hypothetical protein
MATVNQTIGTTWTQIATNAQEFFLSVPFTTPFVVDVATTAADEAPAATILGHPVRPEITAGMNRTLLGDGYVWARCKQGPVECALDVWV